MEEGKSSFFLCRNRICNVDWYILHVFDVMFIDLEESRVEEI